MRYKLDIVTEPVLEPVTVAEVKTALRVDSSDDDTLIGYLITAARQSAESFTKRAFITQTWKMLMDDFCDVNDYGYTPAYTLYSNEPSYIEIPLAPLQSITHLKTYDDSDVATTFASSNYYVSTYGGSFARAGTLTLRDASVWPTFERNKDGIEIQFVAGYGTAASDVPQQIRMAVQEQATFLYNNRGSCDGATGLSMVAKQMLNPFRIIKF